MQGSNWTLRRQKSGNMRQREVRYRAPAGGPSGRLAGVVIPGVFAGDLSLLFDRFPCVLGVDELETLDHMERSNTVNSDAFAALIVLILRHDSVEVYWRGGEEKAV